MPKLYTADQPVITHQFLGQILKNYGIEEFTYELATSGIENTTVLVSSTKAKVVVRIYRQNKKSQKDIEVEIAFMQALAQAGIPVPAICTDKLGAPVGQFQTDNARWCYVVMDFVAGEHPKTYTTGLIKELAYIHAKMHRLGAEFVLNYHGRS